MTLHDFRSAACRDTVSRLLVVVFAFFLLFPFHYHIRHVDEPIAADVDHPAHVADLHAHADPGSLDHQADSHTVAPGTPVSLKCSGLHLPWVVILVAFVLLLPLRVQARQPLPLPLPHRLPRVNRHSTPPLRAPPRH